MNRRTVTAALCFALPVLALHASAAHAQTPSPTPLPFTDEPDDLVRLRDGTRLRGRIAERRADGTLVMVLLTGETRSIPATAIEPLPPPPPAIGPSREDDEAPAVLVPTPGRVPLLVESTGGPLQVGYGISEMVGNISLTGSVTTRRELCQTPCTLYVRDGLFRLYTGGPNRWDRTTYLMIPTTGKRVRMHAGTMAGRVGGVAMMIGGIAAIGISGFALLLTTGHRSDGPSPAAIGGMIAGAGMLAGGIVLNVVNPIGLASHGPLESPATAERAQPLRWQLGAAPLPGGGVAALALQF
jgi:hypothetical protein